MKTKLSLSFFLYFTLVTLLSCSNRSSSQAGSTTAAIETSIWDSLGIREVASSVTQDVGYISDAFNGNSGRNFLIFEETHISVLGQVESAVMLNRLIRDYQLQDIALEGEFVSTGRLKADWFHLLGAAELAEIKKKYAAQSLQEGEISAAEFITLLYPEVEVFGIEKKDEYTVDLPDDAKSATNMYLFGIVAKSISQSQYNVFERMMKKGETAKAIEYLFGLDSFTKEKYKLLTSNDVISAEESIQIYKEIQRKAESVSAQIDSKFKHGMEELIEFFTMASQRSKTMVDNSLAKPNRACAMIIGAAHTARVKELLQAEGHSFAIITPASLKKSVKEGDLALDAYHRKMNGLSVDTLILGQILGGEKKPQTVINRNWYRSKTELYMTVELLVAADGGGGHPPFNNTLNLLTDFTSTKIDPSSIEKIDEDVLFKISILTEMGTWENLWVRAANIEEEEEEENMDTEDRLMLAMRTISEQSHAPKNIIISGDKKYQVSNTNKNVELKPISPDVMMAVSKDEKAIRGVQVGK